MLDAILDLMRCTTCGQVMAVAEAWKYGRCEACALRADPMACPACKGKGLRYVPARDPFGCFIRQVALCEACGGEG